MGKSDKRERKKTIIQKYLPNCYYSTSVFTYGRIPHSKIDGACSAYSGYVDYDDVFGLIDETVFGSGKRGMLFTENGFYTDGSSGYHEYKDGITFRSLSNGYNLTSMNEMLTKLYEIEAEPSGWEIAGSLLGTAFDLLQAISEETETEPDSSSTREVYEENYLDNQNLLEEEETDEFQDDSTEWEEGIEALLENANHCYETLTMISIKIDNVLKTQSYEIIKPLSKLKTYLDSCMMPDGTSVESIYDRIMRLGDDSTEIENELEKIAMRSRKKIKYYLSQLRDCDEDEIEAIGDACKKELKKYQEKIKEAILFLDDLLSECM